MTVSAIFVRVILLPWLLLKALWNILWGKETPLVITVLLAVAAAILSPMVTEKFERQKMRSEYVLANLREINALVSDVYVQVTTISYEVAEGKAAPEKSIGGIRDDVAKLNWSLIQTAALLPPSEVPQLQRFQKSVVAVSAALDGKLDVAGTKVLLTRVETMAIEATKVIRAIGRNAELSAAVGHLRMAEANAPPFGASRGASSPSA